MPPNLSIVKANAHKITHTKTDIVLVTPDLIAKWKKPPFQREFQANAKVKEVTEEIRDTSVIPGTVVLGVLDGETYLVDAQHRLRAFLMTGMKEAYAEVRTHFCDSMKQMSNEYRKINAKIRPQKPDDELRAMEFGNEALQLIRRRCSFVGYDNIRRGDSSPVVSMSRVIRAWFAATTEIPRSGGESAASRCERFLTTEANACADFLGLALPAWTRQREYSRLWAACNMTLCMWLYRRMVMGSYSAKSARVDKEMFQSLLSALSADKIYMDWLGGRTLTDRDRAPGYNHVKRIFAKRLHAETGKKPSLPSPSWAH